MPRVRAGVTPARVLLALILAGGFALRIWNNDYGLPYVWGVDEGTHFTSRAVEMFRQGLDPGYYQNPTAYTYLVYLLLRLMYGPLGAIFDLSFDNVTEQFNKDPTQIWIAARTLAGVLGAAGVAAVYIAARRIWGLREGLVAAAVLAVAFLPVAYSRVAVTDVGSLAGVALALYGAVRVHEEGALRHYLLAGSAAGLALGFKYTAGLVLLPLGIAAFGRLRRDRARAAVQLAGALAAAALVFLILNPFVVLQADSAVADLRGQAQVAANEGKLGQESGGFSYYLESLTWGLGWALALCALGGAILELRRSVVRGIVLVSMPLLLFLYLAIQARYFGRWLLPAYPALAMLAGVALVRASELAPARLGARPAARTAALAGLTALALLQPLAADVRTALVLGRDDTREQTRAFLVERFPVELRASIEPAVPGRWYRASPDGRTPPSLERCPARSGWPEPGWRYDAGEAGRVCTRFKPGQFARPDGGVRASAYHFVLGPDVIDDYRFYGYCLVVTYGVVRDRATSAGGPAARAYYRRLEREAVLVRRFSPYDRGARPVPFSFDLSFNYYPTAYERPGPVATIYRLRSCRQRYGAPVIQIPRARELPPFAPRQGRREGAPQDEI